MTKGNTKIWNILKVVSLSLILCLQTYKVHAEDIESQVVITSVLSKDMTDEEKAKEIYLKAYEYMLTDRYVAEDLGKYLITFSRDHDVSKGVALGYTLLGTVCRTSHKYEKAIEFQEKSVEIFDEIGNDNANYAANQIRFEIGVIQSECGNFHAADSIFTSLLPTFGTRNTDQLGLAYLELSVVRLHQRNFESFDTLAVHALNYAKQSGLPYRITSVMDNKGVSYILRGEYDEAESIYKELLDNYQESISIDRACWAASLGETYFEKKEYLESKKWLDEAFQLFVEAGYHNKNIYTLSYLTLLALRESDLDLAKKYIAQAESNVYKNRDEYGIGTISFLKASLAYETPKQDSVREYLKKSLQLSVNKRGKFVDRELLLLSKILKDDGLTEASLEVVNLAEEYKSAFSSEYPIDFSYSRVEPYFTQLHSNNKIVLLSYSLLMAVGLTATCLLYKYKTSRSTNKGHENTESSADNGTLSESSVVGFQELIEEKVVKEEVYLRPDLNVGDVAELLEIPPRQLSKFIKETYGLTYTQFINKMRMDKVIELIEDDPSLRTADLMDKSGINTRATFANIFKGRTGMSLTDYKKKCMEENKWQDG